MHKHLSKLESAADLHGMTTVELNELAAEIRDVLCNLLSERTAHFASNLGVVELALALHSVFDFRYDRLIWDTGHQIYPHKLLTGRYHEFPTIRTKGGLMGYPNPQESEYDLFMTGHAGSSIATLSGMHSGDELLGLVRGLLYSGARAVLLTLWDVNDESTAEFMKCFYTKMAATDDKSDALRQAVQELRQSYPDVYHWAPFVLIGNPIPRSQGTSAN